MGSFFSHTHLRGSKFGVFPVNCVAGGLNELGLTLPGKCSLTLPSLSERKLSFERSEFYCERSNVIALRLLRQSLRRWPIKIQGEGEALISCGEYLSKVVDKVAFKSMIEQPKWIFISLFSSSLYWSFRELCKCLLEFAAQKEAGASYSRYCIQLLFSRINK